MRIQEISEALIAVLREIQETSGRDWKDPGSGDKPIGDLVGFDSLSSIEATVMLEEKLGGPLGVDSLFISENGRRALTMREIVERIVKLLRVREVTK